MTYDLSVYLATMYQNNVRAAHRHQRAVGDCSADQERYHYHVLRHAPVWYVQPHG